MSKEVAILPRVIRAFEAPRYLGVDKNRFNREIRPYLIAVPLGDRAIGFDRLDLDQWWEEYKAIHGRPGAKLQECVSETNHKGVSNQSSTNEFNKALQQVLGGRKKEAKGG